MSVDRDEAHPQAVRSDAYMRLLQENERPARPRSSANTPIAKGSNWKPASSKLSAWFRSLPSVSQLAPSICCDCFDVSILFSF
ncbi:MAG: hypothetical protein D6680_13130 [Cyanobacteria bacterium J007]|nr:MAG: hypothetical protein D6680_13130 [Cyanobacteria bacterium J007]